jgi:branched-chain amino acid transport system ATP-binding protein
VSALLELEDVRASYGRGDVLHGISLCVEQGAFVALLGANGAGKSTALRAMTGAVRTTGTIRFAGHDLRTVQPEEAARLGIAHVPEGRGTLSAFTVRENLLLGAYTQRSRTRVRHAYERSLALFPRLAERARQTAGTLSGGEQQMLAVARALMMEPRLMLLDEPSLGLAPLIVREIFALLSEINRTEGMTIVVAEQNARLALAAADRAYVLESGRIAIGGRSESLMHDEKIRYSYLGY